MFRLGFSVSPLPFCGSWWVYGEVSGFMVGREGGREHGAHKPLQLYKPE